MQPDNYAEIANKLIQSVMNGSPVRSSADEDPLTFDFTTVGPTHTEEADTNNLSQNVVKIHGRKFGRIKRVGSAVSMTIPMSQRAFLNEHRAQTTERSGSKNMSELTREELDAKLEARDAKAEVRMARIEERINNAINNMADSSKQLRTDLKDDVKNLEAKIESQKKTTWSAAAVTIATVLTGYALMFQAFDTGRETASLTESAAQSVKNASELLGKVQASLDEQVKRSKDQPPLATPTDQPVIQK